MGDKADPLPQREYEPSLSSEKPSPPTTSDPQLAVAKQGDAVRRLKGFSPSGATMSQLPIGCSWPKADYQVSYGEYFGLPPGAGSTMTAGPPHGEPSDVPEGVAPDPPAP